MQTTMIDVKHIMASIVEDIDTTPSFSFPWVSPSLSIATCKPEKPAPTNDRRLPHGWRYIWGYAPKCWDCFHSISLAWKKSSLPLQKPISLCAADAYIPWALTTSGHRKLRKCLSWLRIKERKRMRKRKERFGRVLGMFEISTMRYCRIQKEKKNIKGLRSMDGFDMAC